MSDLDPKGKLREPPPGEGGCPDFASIVRQTTADSSLFEQVVDCFADQLAAFARYTCRDETLGQDAFQEAMIAAMTHLGTYRGDAPIEPWLRRIVVTSCSRLKRGKKNDPRLNVPLDEQRAAAPAGDEPTDQELQLMMVQSLDLVRREIDKLDEPNRTLLVEHDIKERPIADLAAAHELTPEAIKSRLKRARATVREALIEQI